MATYADEDLISLTEASAGSPFSAAPPASVPRKTVQRDSFSDLTGLMRAKKPYLSGPSPAPASSGSTSISNVQFSSRPGSGNSILSPLARSYHPHGSVAAYLQDQARSSTTAEAPPTHEYSQQKMRHLELMFEKIETLLQEDDDTLAVTRHIDASEPLVPDLELPAKLPKDNEPFAPPTPAPSVRPDLPEEPCVRVTLHVWDALSKDMNTLTQQNRALESKIAQLEMQKGKTQVEDCKTDLETQIGKLQYQNESNKNQKAAMARTLSEKDYQIKQLQLDLDSANERFEASAAASKGYNDAVREREYFQTTLKNEQINNARSLSDLTNAKNQEITTLSKKVNDLQATIDQTANSYSNDYKVLAEIRLDQLNQREKLLRSSKEKYAAEHMKVGQLEDRVEDLQRSLDQVGDLRSQLKEKTSACDRLRTDLRNHEKMLEDANHRLIRASNQGQSLRGAAHVVKPSPNTKLPSLVMGCTECYAKNLTCDNKACCRSCSESNETCARWRCSLKHILGTCPTIPCTFPHEADGWLLATEPRPQW